MATNRADTLDPALLRPGRLDRKIEFPTPDRRQKRLVFQTITSKMINLEIILVIFLMDLESTKDKIIFMIEISLKHMNFYKNLENY